MTSESERIIGLYQRHAAVWDRLRSPGSLFEKPWLDRFRALLSPGASILDVGCGAGLPISGYLIESGFAVTGVDTSGPLVELCRGRFPGQKWAVADMRTIELDRQFDGILAWDSFFHLSPEDQLDMFPIFGRHAGPNCALMFTSGPQHGEVLGEFEGEPLYHGSLDPAEYRAVLEENGFAVVAYVEADRSCGDHTIWLAQRG
ncbi:MAG: class I SAM-dependent methyltransferase [Acidobacteriaceae bacterium]